MPFIPFQSPCEEEPQRSRSSSWHASLLQDFLTEMRIVGCEICEICEVEIGYTCTYCSVPSQRGEISAEKKAIPHYSRAIQRYNGDITLH